MLSALEPIAAYFGIGATMRTLGQSMGWLPDSALMPEDLQWAAQTLGLRSRLQVISPDAAPTGVLHRGMRMRALKLPVMVLGSEGIGVLAVMAKRQSASTPAIQGGGTATSPSASRPSEEWLVWRPDATKFEWLPAARIFERWAIDGRLRVLLFHQPLRLTSTPGSAAPRFGLGWFVPVLWRYRKPLGQVLLGAFLLQLVALSMPLFSQVIIDKVLMHRSLSTLHVLGIGMAGLILFEAITGMLRGYMLAHTSARLDAGLSSDLYRHLVSLPVRYFEQRQAGDILARTRELESIRGFFTGGALTTLLDGLFIGVFIAVMLLYSLKLTIVVLVGLPLLAAISLIAQPVFARALQAKFDRTAEAGSFMVESIQGMQTIKSLALGAILQRRWDLLAARQVTAGLDVAALGNIAQSLSQGLQRVMMLAVLWYGTTLVMDNALTVGGLIAFQMLAGQVLQPVARLVALWQNFQQVKLSVDRMGDLMNARTEPSPVEAQALPPLRGAVEFQSVQFRYQPEAPLVLNDINLVLAPGEVVGIVGRSGCGKSTLAKLIQRLYAVELGRVLLDGQDVSAMDPQALRRQLGVVLQDSFLFNGTIAENIAIAQPGASLERIIAAAELAGAHEFINLLPQGYHSRVGERGALLSGGQRQRVAIARALIGNPRVLIFDEATSALDVESEQAIQANMVHICRGRTVLMIAHRLSTLRPCDRIIVLDGGKVVEQGPMHELIASGGMFARLWAMQNSDAVPHHPPAGQTTRAGENMEVAS